MPRFVAFLRGVSPMNARMPDLIRAFESAGFTDVKTLLSSGNVVFTTRMATPAVLKKRSEAAMQAALGRTFTTFVRPAAHLQALLAKNPFAAFDLPPSAKRIVTFLPDANGDRVALPIERDGACILAQVGADVFAAYEPSLKGPVFMTLLERTFGKDITTRTLGTVTKCAGA